MKTEAKQTLMSFDRARACADRIKKHLDAIGDELDSAKVLILELYEGAGWLALGHKNFRECASWEFGKSVARIYALLQEAKIEREISCAQEMHRKSPRLSVRASKALASLPEGTRKEAYEESTMGSNGHSPTTAKVKEVVERHLQIEDARANLVSRGIAYFIEGTHKYGHLEEFASVVEAINRLQ